MLVTVSNGFYDLTSGKWVESGNVLDTTPERAAELAEKGFVESKKTKTSKKDSNDVTGRHEADSKGHI